MSQPARPAQYRSYSTPGAETSPAGDRQPHTLPPISTSPQYSQQHGSTTHNDGRPSISGGQPAFSPTSEHRSGEPTSSRSFKMHSLLNHPTNNDAQGRPADGTPAELSRSLVAGSKFAQRPPDPHGMSPTTQGSTALPSVSQLPLSNGPPQQQPRTSDHHEAPRPFAGFPPHSASFDPKQSPFPPHVSPPQLSAPNGQRPSYPLPPQSTTSTDRRGSDTNPTAPQSRSNSPSTSYSSYGQTTKNSPAANFTQVAGQAHAGQTYSNGPPSALHNPHGDSRGPPPGHHSHATSHRSSISSDAPYHNGPSSNAQGTYQLMTLDTGQGPIQVPVDMQAASKMADEKRKRNAGASARFRQRRKEKEQEASHTISRLESQVRDLDEQKEYYRLERDYFRGLIYQSNAQIHVAPRMPSPKMRSPRTRKVSVESSSAGGSATEWQQSGERGSDDGRNQRRRISSMEQQQPPTPGAQQQQQPPPHQQQQHHPQAQGYGPPPPPPQQQHPHHQLQQHHSQSNNPQYAQGPPPPGAYQYPPRHDRRGPVPGGAAPPPQSPIHAHGQPPHYPPQLPPGQHPHYDRPWKPPGQ